LRIACGPVDFSIWVSYLVPEKQKDARGRNWKKDKGRNETRGKGEREISRKIERREEGRKEKRMLCDLRFVTMVS
jgi:hypothetical protein